MKHYTANNIRNIAFAGHSSSGKTTLCEAALFLAGATDRFGKVADGNTVSDFDPEEIRRKVSISTTVAPLEWKNTKINILDTPGLFDFAGGVYEGARAVENVLITMSARSGLTVGAEKAYALASDNKLAKIIFINKMDSENADFNKVVAQLTETYGNAICPLVVPVLSGGKVQCLVDLVENKAYTYANGKATETAMPALDATTEGYIHSLNELVAETSEELMDKYFAEEPFTHEELISGISEGMKNGTIVPVFCGSAQELLGIDLLLDAFVKFAPSPAKFREEATDASGNAIALEADENAPTAAIIFKTVADPFIGKLSYFKVVSGKVSSDSQLKNSTTGNVERIAKVLFVRGKKQQDTDYVPAGDIGAVAKLTSTNTGDTLCSPDRPVTLKGVDFPAPCLSMAIFPTNKGDEEKISNGLNRLKEEDPTIKVENSIETRQLILSALGEQHIDVIISKLKSKFGVNVTMETPKVAYRETIRKKVKSEGKHKKQTGGHGQYGHVWIEFEPCDSDDLVFEEKIFGGSVPRTYFPAVEKGLREAIQKGVLAGYPVVGLKATLVDGSYHPVDSSELSFKMAASIAYKEGLPKASPVLLEPIGILKVLVPSANMGDVMGEITKRRGRVLGMGSAHTGIEQIDAEVPMAEMHDFSVFLRSVTQGRGNFSFTFDRYEEVPPMIAQKVIEEAKKANEQ